METALKKLVFVIISIFCASLAYADLQPEICQPAPDGQSCSLTVCPDANNECIPTKIRIDYNGQSPTYTILECKCMDIQTDCHINIDPQLEVYPTGICSDPNNQCQLFETDNGDGTIDYECDCAPILSEFLTGDAPPCNEPVVPTTPTPANGAVGVLAKLLPTPTYPTLSWSPAAGGDNPRYDVYFETGATPVTVVSANQTATSYVASGAVQGKTYYWQIVAKNDCNTTGVSSAIWSFNTDCMNIATTPALEYTAWAGGGAMPWSKPSCWCYQRHCRGDINGTIQTPYWVYTQDLEILKDAYGKLVAQLTGNRICADINLSVSSPYRVYTQDLAVLKAYYGRPATQVPVCTKTVNFWTN